MILSMHMANTQVIQKLLPTIGNKDRSLVFVDGEFFEALSKSQDLPIGVSMGVDTVSGINEIVLDLRDKVVFDVPMHLIFLMTEESAQKKGCSFDLKVRAGASTRLNLVYHFLGRADAFSQINCKTQAHLSENACVDFFVSEELGGSGAVFAEQHFYLKKHASVDSVIFTEGGLDSKHQTFIHFTEPHGFASLKGLSMLRAAKKASHEIEVIHAAPHCISRQYYKSILLDQSVGEYDSLVWVQADAVKSDSQQLNRNLLLSPEAVAISSPRLRIDNDDVAASHGSASGDLSDTELFYLQSRGISKKEAESLLIYGFAEEIIAEIQEKSLRTHLEKVIEKWKL